MMDHIRELVCGAIGEIGLSWCERCVAWVPDASGEWSGWCPACKTSLDGCPTSGEAVVMAAAILRGVIAVHACLPTCANCGEPSTSTRKVIAIGDGEWVCSDWCIAIHEEEGCPLESNDGPGEMARRMSRRLSEKSRPEVAPLCTGDPIDCTYFGCAKCKPATAMQRRQVPR